MTDLLPVPSTYLAVCPRKRQQAKCTAAHYVNIPTKATSCWVKGIFVFLVWNGSTPWINVEFAENICLAWIQKTLGGVVALHASLFLPIFNGE